MPNFSRNEVVLVRYPFSDLSNIKVRPAVVMSAPHISQDVFIVALTSKTAALLPGEFVLRDWSKAGLNTSTAVKRNVYTLHTQLIIKSIGRLTRKDSQMLEHALKQWFGLA